MNELNKQTHTQSGEKEHSGKMQSPKDLVLCKVYLNYTPVNGAFSISQLRKKEAVEHTGYTVVIYDVISVNYETTTPTFYATSLLLPGLWLRRKDGPRLTVPPLPAPSTETYDIFR